MHYGGREGPFAYRVRFLGSTAPGDWGTDLFPGFELLDLFVRLVVDRRAAAKLLQRLRLAHRRVRVRIETGLRLKRLVHRRIHHDLGPVAVVAEAQRINAFGKTGGT